MPLNTTIKSGYKQTEVGVIPSDWDVKELRNIGQCFIGLTYKPSDVKSDGVLVLRASNVQRDTLEFNDTVFVDVAVPERALVHKDDILICVRNGSRDLIGKCALIDDRARGMAFGAFMAVFRTLDHGFVFQQFRSGTIKRQIQENLGATINQITNKNLESFRIPWPREQIERRTIAAALTDVDELIDELDKLIAKKRDLKQAAMQQLLTGQTRLPGFSGKWEVKRLGDLCTMKSGEGITARNIDDFSPFPCYGGNGLRGFATRYTHEGNYCLIGRVGALCGNLLQVTGQFFASEHAIVASAFENVDVGWLTLALGTLRLNRRAESSAQPVLTVSKLLPLEVIAPATKAEQTAIAGVLSDMDAEIAALEQRRDKTRDLKQGMMQELLSGKTRLI
jgi:type I restriction enzyme S subunit